MKQWVARESRQELQGGFAGKPLTHKGRTIRKVMHEGMQGKMIVCVENPRNGSFVASQPKGNACYAGWRR